MLARATFPHLSPAIGVDTDSHLVISLQGEANSTRRPRPAISVIPVVDTSGSMGTDRKLSLVTTALSWLAEHLSGRDQLGLIAFHSRADIATTLRHADPAGLAAFTHSLRRLRPAGSTALADGLRLAIDQANRAAAGNLVRVVVLTDGRANQGPSDLDSLCSVLARRNAEVSVSFLGVGMDCDHELLAQLAENGGGTYGFIETAADAPSALGNEIGGLLDAEAHNLNISVRLNPTYAVFGADQPLGVPADLTDDVMTFSVSTLVREVTRHIVIPVTLRGTGRNHARPVTCATIDIDAQHVDGPLSVQLRPKVKFAKTPGALDLDCLEKVELAQVGQAVRAARSAASRGDFAAARSVFAAVDPQSATALSLKSSLVGAYHDAGTYTAGAGVLSSAAAAAAGNLSNTSQAFTAVASATLGNLYSSGQRRMAAGASLGASPSPEPGDPDELASSAEHSSSSNPDGGPGADFDAPLSGPFPALDEPGAGALSALADLRSGMSAGASAVWQTNGPVLTPATSGSSTTAMLFVSPGSADPTRALLGGHDGESTDNSSGSGSTPSTADVEGTDDAGEAR